MYPLVVEHSYWKWPFIVDLPIKSLNMVLFHSYVSLSEGTMSTICTLWIKQCHFHHPPVITIFIGGGRVTIPRKSWVVYDINMTWFFPHYDPNGSKYYLRSLRRNPQMHPRRFSRWIRRKIFAVLARNTSSKSLRSPNLWNHSPVYNHGNNHGNDW